MTVTAKHVILSEVEESPVCSIVLKAGMQVTHLRGEIISLTTLTSYRQTGMSAPPSNRPPQDDS